VLGLPLLIWIGQRSYGLYLWSFPILTVCRSTFDLPIAVAGPISIAGAFICAAVSYPLVERPFLRRRYSDPKPAGAIQSERVQL